MATDFLDLEVRLLILKYGRDRVLRSLARIGHTTLEEVEAQIQQLAHTKPATKSKRPFSLAEALDRFDVDDAKKEKLSVLAREFEHKRLFPQLRDVVRFCSQHGKPIRPKSRQEALPRVLGILAALPESQLAELTEQAGQNRGDSFARLAEAIIRGSD